jgi:large subunit ribosomal protein L22
MQVSATAKYIRVQPRKVRIIADEVRGKEALQASTILRFHRSKSAHLLKKVIDSAVANAIENHELAPESLRISTIMVDEGPRMKRMRARAQGRGFRIIKKTSHITVVVEDHEPEAAVRPHGTKAKPRPTLAAPAGKKKKGAPAAKAEPKVAAPVVEEETVEEVAAEVTPEEVSAPVEEALEPVETTATVEPVQAESVETGAPVEGAVAEAVLGVEPEDQETK